jgi:Fic family protein
LITSSNSLIAPACFNRCRYDSKSCWLALSFSENDIRSLHHLLLKPYKKAGPNVGEYKVQPNYVIEVNQVTKESRTVFKTADAGPITAAAMNDLLVWYNQAIQDSPWPITVAIEFVFRFLAIHPFQGGNGRLGRGLFVLGFSSKQQRLKFSCATNGS